MEILVKYPAATSPNQLSPFAGWESNKKAIEDSLAGETAMVAGKDIEAVLDSTRLEQEFEYYPHN